jgi:hypothetical protein
MTKLIASLALILATAGSLASVAPEAQADERPKVRDHRKPILCFGGLFGGTTCYRTPWKPR